MFVAKDHAALDNDLVKLAGWADIDTSIADSLKGEITEDCDSMGTLLRSGLNILHWNVAFASAKKRGRSLFP